MTGENEVKTIEKNESPTNKEQIRKRDKRLGIICLMAGVIFLIFMWFFHPSRANAILGMGDIVSDPASYGYYAEQIEAMAAELEKLEESYDELTKHTEKLQDITDKMQGYYSKAKATADQIKGFVDSVSEVPHSFSDLQSKWFKIKGQIETIAGGKEMLDKIFGDIRKLGDDGRSVYEIINDRYQSKQQVLKDTIAASNKDLSSVGEDLAEIHQLASEISQTKTLKESQDLANLILIKQLIVQRRLLSSFNRFSMAQSMISFEGVSDEVSNEIKVQLNEGKSQKVERKYLKDKFRNPNIDSSTITSNDLLW